MSSGKSSRTTETTSDRTPWSGVAPQMLDVNKKAQEAYNAMDKSVYQGPLTADQNQFQNQARDILLGNANQNIGMGNSTIKLGQDTIEGKYLDPNSNPFFAKTVEAALRPIQENFVNNVVPRIGSSAIAGGAYGGARHGLALAQANQDMARQTSDTANQMWNGNYQAERARQMAAPSLVQSGFNLNQMPAQAIGQVGAQLNQIDQTAINDAITKFNAEQNAPWIGLSNYAGLLQGTSGYGTTVQTQIAPKSNSVMQGLLGLGLTLGGAALGGPLGAMLGAGAGAGVSLAQGMGGMNGYAGTSSSALPSSTMMA